MSVRIWRARFSVRSLIVLAICATTILAAAAPASAGAPSNAVAWAQSKIGDPTAAAAYENLCLTFVHDAYMQGAGVDIGCGYGNAVGYWNGHTSLQHPGDTTPPVGGLVFWGATPGHPDGHVAIAEAGASVI